VLGYHPDTDVPACDMTTAERRKGEVPFKAQLDALLDAAVDAIVLIGRDGRITQFNRAAEHMFGYGADEVTGQNVNCLMPEPYRGEHDGYISRYLRTGEARIIGIGREVTGRRRDGSEFPMELSVGEIKSATGHGFVGIIRDVTQRHAFQEQLRLQGEELRLIFDSAPTALVTTTADYRLLRGNRAWYELLGYTEAQIADLSCSDIVHPDDYPAFTQATRQLTQAGAGQAWRSELRLVTRTGGVIHALAQVGAIDHALDGHFFILELVDRTAQALAEREALDLRERVAHLARLNTMGEMATGIAHELNQPLTAISTYAQASRRLIASGRGELAEIVGTLDKIAAQADRAGEVIRRLRAMLVRRESQREHIDSGQLVRDVVRLAEIDLRERNLVLKLRVNHRLPAVFIDKVQIQQVVLNLLRNGIEAMSEASTANEIAIATALADDGMLEISVSDSGPGVSEAAASRLFEAFFTTKPQGLGMGLAICRSIAQSHGGDLVFSNNRYGGATFTLRLPVSEEDADHAE
jgi:two-component system, LuxR family, sensor kinase FixL